MRSIPFILTFITDTSLTFNSVCHDGRWNECRLVAYKCCDMTEDSYKNTVCMVRLVVVQPQKSFGLFCSGRWSSDDVDSFMQGVSRFHASKVPRELQIEKIRMMRNKEANRGRSIVTIMFDERTSNKRVMRWQNKKGNVLESSPISIDSWCEVMVLIRTIDWYECIDDRYLQSSIPRTPLEQYQPLEVHKVMPRSINFRKICRMWRRLRCMVRSPDSKS